MDSLRGQISGEDPAEEASLASPLADARDSGNQPPAGVAKDERRMQVRAYNFWASLLGNRQFPDIADLHPESLGDFGPYSVLLDFSERLEDPRIAYLGRDLAGECGISEPIHSLDQVPGRSLLSRITDHYMQIIANQAPIGFEAEFVNQRGITILYRGILLPFSRDDRAIDHIYGVINWKERREPLETAPAAVQNEPAAEVRPAMLRSSLGWADGPLDRGMVEPLGDHHSVDECFQPVVQSAEDMELSDWLASARELALLAHGSEDRSRQTLYSAVSRAYDFALAAAGQPEAFAELIEDAGLKVQARAPLTPLVKLVFGADYDKTRLTEFATVIAHGQRLGLECGSLAAYLRETPGGLKALVKEERRLRRAESGNEANARSRRDAMIQSLRALEPKSMEAIGKSAEFTLLVARQLESGEVVMLGEVAGDDALLDRAARHLLS
jgi:hypothetical protein